MQNFKREHNTSSQMFRVRVWGLGVKCRRAQKEETYLNLMTDITGPKISSLQIRMLSCRTNQHDKNFLNMKFIPVLAITHSNLTPVIYNWVYYTSMSRIGKRALNGQFELCTY